jgi:thiamine pyrophosphate-dependent acetolactate synthase large subunit-like protein
MSGLELLTAVRENISLTVIVFNDGYLGRIRLEQLAATGRTNCIKLQNPNFEAFALAVGADYVLVEGDPDSILRKCFAQTGITIVELRLGDGPSVHTARVRGIARNAVRKTFGTKLAKRLKDLMPRSS